MWIVANNRGFYPSVDKFDTCEEALERYNKEIDWIEDENLTLFIAEVKDHKEFHMEEE